MEFSKILNVLIADLDIKDPFEFSAYYECTNITYSIALNVN